MPARAAIVMTLGLAVTLVAGCSSSGEPSQPDDNALRIAVIPKGTTHEYWKSVHAGALHAADEAGDVKILWKGALRENDTPGQIQVVQSFTAQGVDGICLAPLDSQAMVGPVAGAISAGIPVLTFDSALGDGPEIVSYVATNNWHGGELAADRIAEALGGEGNVILLRYMVGSQSTMRREEGFLDRLAKAHPGITVIESEEYIGTTPHSSLTKASQILNKYHDEVDGIFAVCEPNADGTLQALRDTGLAGDVKLVTFDPSPTLIRGMEEGVVHGIILQDPVTMGYKAVKTMLAHLKGEKVPDRIETGVYVATPQNMNEPKIHRLLSPEEFEE